MLILVEFLASIVAIAWDAPLTKKKNILRSSTLINIQYWFHLLLFAENMGVSKNRGILPPKWMVKIMENPIKMDDLGGKNPPLFFGNTHMVATFHVWNQPSDLHLFSPFQRQAEKDDLPPLEDLNVDDLDYNVQIHGICKYVFKVTWLVVTLHDQVDESQFY